VTAFRDGAAMLPREHVASEAETPEETEWNDSLESLLDRRVVIRTGLAGYADDGRRLRDGDLLGAENYMRWAANAPLFGFAPFWAAWEKGHGLRSTSDRLILTPLLHSACWTIDEHRLQFMGAAGLRQLPRERLIWISSSDAHYGYPRGQALLRALVQPWTAYQEQVVAEDIDTATRAGIAQIYDGGAGAANAAEWEAIGEAIADGQRWIRIPGKKSDGVGVEMSYPSGTPPDFESKAKRLRGAVDDLFGTEVLSIASNGSGSRAAAETMSAITAKVGIASGDALLDLCFSALANWIAFHDGFGGRIRRVRVAAADDTDPHALVTSLATATGGPVPLIDIGPTRREYIAERLGLPLEDTAEPIAPAQRSPPDPATLAIGEERDLVAYVITGPPGAGKSTRAAIIARDADGPVSVLDADRYLYTAAGVFDWSASNSRAAHAALAHDLAQAVTRGDETIAIVAPLTTAAARAKITSPLRAAGYRVIGVQVTPPVDALLERNAARPASRGVSATVTRAIADNFEPLGADEFDAIEVDSGAWRMAHGAECGHTLATEPPRVIVGGDGLEFTTAQRAIVLTVRGVEVRPESHFPWASDKTSKAERLAEFEAVIADWLPGARDQLLAAAARDDLAIFNATRRELEQVAFDMIAAHLDTARAAARKSRATEAAAQVGSGIVAPADTDAGRWRGMETASRERLDRAARVVASTLVGKIADEVATHVALTGGVVGFIAERTPANYARSVEALDNGVTAGEFESSQAPPGMAITAAVRLSTRAPRRVCDPCKGEHGRTFLFPEDSDEFDNYRGVPDPECTGGTRFCECAWSFVYGTPEGTQ
jgi:predicted kinase